MPQSPGICETEYKTMPSALSPLEWLRSSTLAFRPGMSFSNTARTPISRSFCPPVHQQSAHQSDCAALHFDKARHRLRGNPARCPIVDPDRHVGGGNDICGPIRRAADQIVGPFDLRQRGNLVREALQKSVRSIGHHESERKSGGGFQRGWLCCGPTWQFDHLTCVCIASPRKTTVLNASFRCTYNGWTQNIIVQRRGFGPHQSAVVICG